MLLVYVRSYKLMEENQCCIEHWDGRQSESQPVLCSILEKFSLPSPGVLCNLSYKAVQELI